jgi:hypothetical protein
MSATRLAERLTLRLCARCVKKHCRRRVHVDRLGRPGLHQGEQSLLGHHEGVLTSSLRSSRLNVYGLRIAATSSSSRSR